MGLVQRALEAAGLSTIILANTPDLAVAVNVPRIAGIEHPFGQTVGKPGDKETQMAVLRATLDALQTIQNPGEIVHLPFDWVEDPLDITHQLEAPPIVDYLLRHPWHVRNLLKREIPERFKV